jgi:hypothetical protein
MVEGVEGGFGKRNSVELFEDEQLIIKVIKSRFKDINTFDTPPIL